MNTEKYTTYPVGTIVDVHGTQATVAGYNYTKAEDRVRFDYLILPFPLGYADANSLKTVAASEVKLVSLGFEDDMCRAYCTHFNRMRACADEMTYDDFMAGLALAAEKQNSPEALKELTDILEKAKQTGGGETI